MDETVLYGFENGNMHMHKHSASILSSLSHYQKCTRKNSKMTNRIIAFEAQGITNQQYLFLHDCEGNIDKGNNVKINTTPQIKSY